MISDQTAVRFKTAGTSEESTDLSASLWSDEQLGHLGGDSTMI